MPGACLVGLDGLDCPGKKIGLRGYIQIGCFVMIIIHFMEKIMGFDSRLYNPKVYAIVRHDAF